MYKMIVYSSVLALALGASFTHSTAQPRHHAGYQYNASNVATVSGDISAIESVSRGWGGSTGTHIVLNTGSGSITVYAGPSWYVQERVQLARGDRIEVTGSRISVDGKPGIVAKELKKGAVTVALRNDDGTPLWAGHGRRHRR